MQEEKDDMVVQNNSLQTDLRAKKAQVHELETSLTAAQQALEDMQQLKITHKRLNLEKCELEKEKKKLYGLIFSLFNLLPGSNLQESKGSTNEDVQIQRPEQQLPFVPSGAFSEQRCVHESQTTEKKKSLAAHENKQYVKEVGGDLIKCIITIPVLEKEKQKVIFEMFDQQVQTYAEFQDHSSDKLQGVGRLIAAMLANYRLLFKGTEKGSLIIIFNCQSIEHLEHLWNDYCCGRLDEMAEQYLVTDEVKEKLNLETIKVKTTIEEKNYLNCRKVLVERSGIDTSGTAEILRSEQQLPSVLLETFYEPHYSMHESEANEENKVLAMHGNSALGGFGDEQCEENTSSRQSTSLDSTSLQQALEDIQQLINENNKLKLEKCQWEKEKNDVQEEKDELVVQNDSLQTDLRAKKGQVHELETSLTTAQQALEDMQQLKIKHKRLKLEKCQLEKEKNDVQEEKDDMVVENISLQTDLRAKKAQMYELETSLTTAQQALEDMQQLKIKHKRLKLEKCQLEREKNDVQQEKDALVVQNNSLQTDLRAKKAQMYELETSLTTAQQALEGMQQLKITHKRLKLEKCQLEEEKYVVQQEKDELVVQNNSLQTDFRAKETQVHRLERSLATSQRALEECQQIKEHFDWVVSRDEVQITEKCLGVGGWGKVSLGSFRGCKVAVKEIHEAILSPYNRRLFEREMNIASRCRHPCLLQFIGATNDNASPLFITELLDTSLRALLEQRQLADTEISIISLDVSLALNYLHNMKPSPILHRDVSSANVLLWRQGDQWRGKVSDYGTAKFVQQTMTRAPGAAIYSAPEAVSSNQTPKMDVYSFGVLLCEMCIREMPDPQRRPQQVLLVKRHVLRDLVRECLLENPAERPEMSEIIKEIERFEG
ncbi:myosin-11-like [Acropora millepora]|uniref:myosin-11-like n=1 Tax=Acropora millepora TaxID=45264 RepID=UPI001CF399B7|nr:myosin-11-like [Acropora millepora]